MANCLAVPFCVPYKIKISRFDFFIFVNFICFDFELLACFCAFDCLFVLDADGYFDGGFFGAVFVGFSEVGMASPCCLFLSISSLPIKYSFVLILALSEWMAASNS